MHSTLNEKKRRGWTEGRDSVKRDLGVCLFSSKCLDQTNKVGSHLPVKKPATGLLDLMVVYHLHGQTNQFTVWVNVKGNRLEIVFTEKSPRRPETGIIDGFKKNEM